MPVKIVAGILVVAATATLADWIWYTFGVRHSVTAGLVHGAALLTVVGAALGASAGRLLRGLPIGTIAGVGGALAYYAFIVWIDDRPYGPAIPAAWIVMWLLLAVLEGRWLRAPARRSWVEIAVRGGTAALLSGVTFYLTLSTLWGAPPAGGRNYAIQFTAWAFAWAPGLAALAAGRAGRSVE
ncbi:MAG TPA: hypothetical protein VD788_05830 [Candidatus Polarisedimenticolaceae bacterium]|nr:hypothetical protein [Candidatus Polarisedimenticolaceae bacterium]